jgi:hypothetical protein
MESYSDILLYVNNANDSPRYGDNFKSRQYDWRYFFKKCIRYFWKNISGLISIFFSVHEEINSKIWYTLYNKPQALVARTRPPFFLTLSTNLFSIKFLYFFIISSLFPYFNLFVSIFIQSYVNIKLHVSTLVRATSACVTSGLRKSVYHIFEFISNEPNNKL